MKKTLARQLAFDGSEEAPPDDSGGFREFMKLSVQEQGLLHPAQAAHVLDVSPQRVLELMAHRRLRSWRFWGRPYLSASELHARAQAIHKGGRPRRPLVTRLIASAKTMSKTDRKQLAAALLGK